MARFCALVVFLLLCLSMFGYAAPADDLTGQYKVDGTNPVDDSTYTGVIDITGKGEQWALHWTFQQGEAVGIGIRQGHVLSVIFQTHDGAIGLVSFAIEENAQGDVTLKGRWTIPGTGVVASEVLTRVTQRV